MTLELPFTLSHPKPAEETPPPTPVQAAPSEEAVQGKHDMCRDGREESLYFDCKPSTPSPTTILHRENSS